MKILEKIKKFLKGLTSNKRKLIQEKNENSNINNLDSNVPKKDNASIFLESIGESNEREMYELQRKLESGNISVYDISIFEVMDLIGRYEKQV